MFALMIAYYTDMSLKDDDKCSSDKNSKKGPPAKVLWYLSIILRFKRLFVNGDDAKDLT